MAPALGSDAHDGGRSEVAPSERTQAADASRAVARDARWAVPLAREGLPNLHRVAAGLYRGAQPDRAGFVELRALGVKTIVNLRSAHSDVSLIESSGVPAGTFQYIEIPLTPWSVDEEDLVRFLRIAIDPVRQPLFVHCQYGADRTGAAVASYRIAVEGWSAEEAAREMTDGGYDFHPIWSNLVRTVMRLDGERLRGKLAR